MLVYLTIFLVNCPSLLQAIEAPTEKSTKYWVRTARQRSIDKIWQLAAEICNRPRQRQRRSETVAAAVTDHTTTSFADVDAAYAAQIGAVLLDFQNDVLNAVQDGWDGSDEVTESKLQWSFAGALLYAVTVITTIGNISTHTVTQ